MASSSNPPEDSNGYQNASNANVSNFISVKLSGYGNYDIWKTQMLFLLEAHDMRGIVDENWLYKKQYHSDLERKYESLLKGWISGSISEDVLRLVVDSNYSAKDVWKKLETYYGTTMNSDKKDSDPVKAQEAESEKKYKDENYPKKRDHIVQSLKNYIQNSNWAAVSSTLIYNIDALTETLDDRGNTALHIAVENDRTSFIKRLLLWYRGDLDLTEMRNSFGSTVLHSAVISGNTIAVRYLVQESKNMLNVKDNEGKTPLNRAYEFGILETYAYLQRAEYLEKNKKDSDSTEVGKGIKTKAKDAETELKHKDENYPNKREYILWSLRHYIGNGNWDAVFCVLIYNKDAITETFDVYGNTALHIMAAKGYDYLIKDLLSWYEGDLDLTVIKNWYGSTLLHFAIICGNTTTTQFLVQEYKDLLNIKDNEGKTPLIKAYECGHEEIISYLKRAEDSEINKKDSLPANTSKEIEAEAQDTETELKYKDENYLKKRENIVRSLKYYIQNENWGAVFSTLLYNIDAITESVDSHGNTTLHIWIEKGVDYCIKALLSWYIGDLDLTEIKNKSGSTLLHYAIICGNTTITRFLVDEYKSLVNIKDKEDKTPLDIPSALVHQIIPYLKSFEYLEKNKKESYPTNVGGEIETTNQGAQTEMKYKDNFFPKNREHKPDPTNVGGEIETTTQDAQTEMKYKDKNYPKNREHIVWCIQRYIVKDNWEAIYCTLIYNIDAIKEKVNDDGDTALHLAVRNGKNDFIRRLLSWYMSDLDLTTIKDSQGRTVLHVATIYSNAFAAELFIKHNKKLLETKDDEDKTPIDRAAELPNMMTGANVISATPIYRAAELPNMMTVLTKGETYAKKRPSIIERLEKNTSKGNWDAVYSTLYDNDINVAIKEKVNSDGNTALHIAVETGSNDFIRKISQHMNVDELTEIKNIDGSTVLHTAAIFGNKEAAELLVKKNLNLLTSEDKKGHTPLDKAVENMHFDIIQSLLEAAKDKRINKNDLESKGKTESSLLVSFKGGSHLLANAISAKQYNLATKLVNQNPEYAVSDDAALMALARTFPRGLNDGERLIYPRLDRKRKMIIQRTKKLFEPNNLPEFVKQMLYIIFRDACRYYGFVDAIVRFVTSIGLLLILVPVLVICVICALLLMVYFTLFMLYLLLWKIAASVVPAIKNIELKYKNNKDAKKVLKLICDKIEQKEKENKEKKNREKEQEHSTRDLYTGSILEAACQDAYEVVEEILRRWPNTLLCKDKNGYDIIQLSTIHRSERIYNLIYIMGKRKSIYGTKVDKFKNNMLHLAGKLAPSNKLKLRTGAALQLQRELQWREEVRNLVLPTNLTKENIFMETPDMVFTKEHENLVKEGEKWMKTVAESSSITAALITTIVFAAAITVPGGSNQDTGIPMFLKNAAFTVFAIADAISLFSSASALFVFLSILTARFSEEDFLVRLPNRLIIGLCTLLLSTTTMMVAFGATLFLVFSHGKLWVLAPICILAFIPIAFFFFLQFPLILDLIRSTYTSKFGKSDSKLKL